MLDQPDLPPSAAPQLARGLALLLGDETYAAHEAWEELWHVLRRAKDAQQRRRGHLLRALIQLAAGLHLRQQGKGAGAAAVFLRAGLNVRRLLPEEELGSPGVQPAADQRQPDALHLLGLPLLALARSLELAASEPLHDPRRDPELAWNERLTAWQRGDCA
jgi:hypothetical protein